MIPIKGSGFTDSDYIVPRRYIIRTEDEPDEETDELVICKEIPNDFGVGDVKHRILVNLVKRLNWQGDYDVYLYFDNDDYFLRVNGIEYCHDIKNTNHYEGLSRQEVYTLLQGLWLYVNDDIKKGY